MSKFMGLGFRIVFNLFNRKGFPSNWNLNNWNFKNEKNKYSILSNLNKKIPGNSI
jgi:hypothetical protein